MENKVFKLVTATLMSATLWSCSQQNFTPIDQTGTNGSLSESPGSSNSGSNNNSHSTPNVVCTPNQVKVTRPTRVLFLVDQSGSNFDGPYEHPGEATDPLKKFRSGVMSDFITANASKTHVSYGLTVFNDVSSTNLMPSQAPFSTVANFGIALTSFMARADVGATPYKAALTAAYNYVQNDMKTAPANTAYLIAMMTDGYPTDYCPTGSTSLGCPGQVMENAIDADLRKIVDLNPRNVQFSTVYYGKPDGDATSRLHRMADVGLGQFVDANVTSKIDVNDIMEIQQEICVDKN